MFRQQRFEVGTVVTINLAVLWELTPCSVTEVYRCSRGRSETSQQFTRLHEFTSQKETLSAEVCCNVCLYVCVCVYVCGICVCLGNKDLCFIYICVCVCIYIYVFIYMIRVTKRRAPEAGNLKLLCQQEEVTSAKH